MIEDQARRQVLQSSIMSLAQTAWGNMSCSMRRPDSRAAILRSRKGH